MVYVLDKEGRPIMPTERHGKVRRLLRDGKASVVRLQPFTIRLNYDSDTYKQEVCLGINPGSKHFGVSASSEKKELFSAEVVLRDDIVENISTRRELRRGRRFRKTRYRMPRFKNRGKNEGWLAPSDINRIDMHMKMIRNVHDILPVSKTIIEISNFDIQKIHNPSIKGIEYQQGPQMGFWNVREYVLWRDNHVCRNCFGKSQDPVLEVHHIESPKTGGDAPDNLMTLCKTCHQAYHQGKIDLKGKRGASDRNASAVNKMKQNLIDRATKEFSNVSFTYGYITKNTRISNGIAKSDSSDAFCIAGCISASRLPYLFKCRCVRRHNRSLHVCNPKKGGKRRSNLAPHWIVGTRLQRFDIVKWDGTRCFIFGSSAGRLYLKDIEGSRVSQSATVSAKQVRFLSRKKGSMIMQIVPC